MLSAILTTFAALVVLGVILAVVFRVRANSAHSRLPTVCEYAR